MASSAPSRLVAAELALGHKVAFFCLPLVGIAGAVWMFWVLRQPYRDGIKARGVVVRIDWMHRGPTMGPGGWVEGHPVLRFHTREGEDVETRSHLGARPCPLHPGQRVTVLYDPRSPSRAAPTQLVATHAAAPVAVIVVMLVIWLVGLGLMTGLIGP